MYIHHAFIFVIFHGQAMAALYNVTSFDSVAMLGVIANFKLFTLVKDIDVTFT